MRQSWGSITSNVQTGFHLADRRQKFRRLFGFLLLPPTSSVVFCWRQKLFSFCLKIVERKCVPRVLPRSNLILKHSKPSSSFNWNLTRSCFPDSGNPRIKKNDDRGHQSRMNKIVNSKLRRKLSKSWQRINK